MKLNILFLILSISTVSQADITAAYRASNAVVLYDFSETVGDVIDHANPVFGAPLNLEFLAPPSAGDRGSFTDLTYFPGTVGRLTLSAANVIRSRSAATKITNRCSASGSMSVEVWLRNNESVEKRAGDDAAKLDQPLRIVNLSNSLSSRNFTIGQFYNGGNFYESAVRTSQNELNGANSLKEPLMSSVAGTLVPDSTIGRPLAPPQKMVFTLNPTGVARLYLSDLNGYMYLAQTATTGFGTDTPANFLKNWSSTAFLTLGNDNMDAATFLAEVQKRSDYAACGAPCFTNKNRYWKGDLYLVAVYCNEVPRTEVLGAGTDNIIKNVIPPAPINIGAAITPDKLRAQEMFNRLTGAKISVEDQRIVDMAAKLAGEDPVGAAAIATDDPRFLNITVRDFASKMSVRAETINTPLNDFTATVVGFVRDNLSAQGLLTTNKFYMATIPSEAPVGSSLVDDVLRSNNHYQALDLGRYDLGKVLHPAVQQVLDTRNGTIKAVDNPSPAGLLTTRQWMSEHAIAGTNRRMVEYAFREFLCSPMETVADNTGPDNVIGRDVDRFPGGSHSKFTSTCRACHTIMDGFRPAFARWTFSNGFAKHAFVVPAIAMNANEDTSMGMIMDPTVPNVTYKLNKNETVFPDGRVTTDDKWVNDARYGSNLQNFKFVKLSGQGPNEFGQMIVQSPKFPRCMANRVFSQLCKRDIESTDNTFLDNAAADFVKGNYNLRSLFQKIVTGRECLGSAK